MRDVLKDFLDNVIKKCHIMELISIFIIEKVLSIIRIYALVFYSN